jgi:hypothetical protein
MHVPKLKNNVYKILMKRKGKGKGKDAPVLN